MSGNGTCVRARRISFLCACSSDSRGGGTGRGTANAGPATLIIKKNSRLGIGRYPDFSYDASGGRASGRWERTGERKYRVSFDAIEIPPLSSSTTTLFGTVPIPPPLKIEIKPKQLEGTVDVTNSAVDLEFDAGFNFTIGPLYAAPSLMVSTTLTTGASKGEIRSGKGDALSIVMDSDDNGDEVRGSCRLVGVSSVKKVNIRPESAVMDLLFSGFLQLPTEALADLTAEIILEL